MAALGNTLLPFPADTHNAPCSRDFRELSPTPVFAAFWTFAAERQLIFWRRKLHQSPPWTADPIFRDFKFTNAYRASDRVSQYLIRNVIYSGDQTPKEIVFRTLLFKLFNKIGTWELLTRECGELRTATFSVHKYDQILSRAFESRERVYSAAYIMPSGSRQFATQRKHTAHLMLLEQMMKDDLPAKITDCKRLEDLFRVLLKYPLIGDFLGYQYAIDLNYSNIIDFSESEFVVPGPGARNGIRKCFANGMSIPEADVIRLVTDLQEQEFQLRGIDFKWLGGRRLQLIDIQNLFCEIDKYARVRFPQIGGLTNRTRIKQRFRASDQEIKYWYPPKWNVNHRLAMSST